MDEFLLLILIQLLLVLISDDLYLNGELCKIRGAGKGTGIVFDEGLGGEIYTGARWESNAVAEADKWMTIRLANDGLRIVSADSAKEIITICKGNGSVEHGDNDDFEILIGGRDILRELKAVKSYC